MTTLFAYLHHLCAFTLVGALAIEFALIRQELTVSSARSLQVTDLVLGVAAGLLFAVGLVRVFYLEKGPEYYWHSHAFLTKFVLFVIVAFVSVIPTLEFLSWRGAIQAGQVPAIAPSKKKLVTRIIHAELAAIVVIVLCAAIMARGGWV
jgi:putative membrane protein